MAELKHTFTSGRMNKDLDERLLPNGEYRDALNIHVSGSEDGNSGAVENTLGNIKLSSLKLSNPKTIGSIAYPLKDKIYWLVASDFIDGIYEYDQYNDVISPILIDGKTVGQEVLSDISIEANEDNELTISNVIPASLKALTGNVPVDENDEVLVTNNLDISCDDPKIKISIPNNTVLRKENEKFVFKNISYNGQRYGNINFTFDYSKDSVLNFSKDNLITGINIIDDMLFWTDNLNPPRKINISRFKKFTNTIHKVDIDPFATSTIVYFDKKDTAGNIEKAYRLLKEEDINVAKKAPIASPKLELLDTLLEDNTPLSTKINFYQKSSYENSIVDAATNYGSRAKLAGDDIVLENIYNLPEGWQDEKIGSIVSVSGYKSTQEISDSELLYTASIKSIIGTTVTLTVISKEFDVENTDYIIEVSIVEKDPIYELDFVRFGYRWKYRDGEYSAISPFSEAAFIPGDFNYDGKEAFNNGMTNTLRKIVLKNIDRGSDDVEEIEILFKEAKNQNIYTLQAQKRIDFKSSYTITKKQIHSVLPNDQLLRAWDNVPKRAKAQEITANRIIYGNYTQNYDIYNEPEFDVYLTRRTDGLKRSIKSNRNYQIGVVYMDEYNRHSPVVSSQSGAFAVDKAESVLENAFSIKIKSKAPAWASHFKYYIKDVAGEYYNLAADRFYRDEENGYAYISFPSSERNKITKESYLLLKKQHGENVAVLDSNNRYKVIEIFNEAPDFVATRTKSLQLIDDVNFAQGYGDSDVQTTKASSLTPVKGSVKIQIADTSGNDDVNSNDRENIKRGNYIRFIADGQKTNIYKIKNLRFHLEGEDEVEIEVSKPFEGDVDILYTDSGTSASVKSNIQLEILEKDVVKGDKEFDGRFFVKLRDTGALKAISQSLGGKNYFKTDSFVITGDDALKELPRKSGVTRIGRNATGTPRKPLYIPGASGKNDFTFRLEETTVNVSEEILDKFIAGTLVSIDEDPDQDAVYRISTSDPGDRKLAARNNSVVRYRDIKLVDLNDESVDISSFFPTNTDGKEVTLNIVKEQTDDEVPYVKDPAIFETEPVESPTELNIYYETEKAFPIAFHGEIQTLDWYNTFAFGNGVESNRIRDDFNATFISTGVKASTTISEQIKEEHKFNGLIYSGIVNNRSGVNRSNEFNAANTITKDFLPSYGSIQKLHAWDDSLVVLAEDKVLRVAAGKSALYNADGSTNLISDRRVLGDPMEYNGDYGCANPESFASYGFRCYFADKTRGTIIRLSKNGLDDIGSVFMSDFFKDRFFDEGCYNSVSNNNYFLGSYDEYNSLYNITFLGKDTVCWDEGVKGWITRKSFIPEYGLSLNNKYYTYDLGELYQHDSTDVPFNNFYDIQYDSRIELEINDNPSIIKRYKTLGYEGTRGWKANVVTDQQKSSDFFFKNKENKYFANIRGEVVTQDNVDPKKFNFQGLGKAATVSSVGAISNTSVTFKIIPNDTVSYVSTDHVFNQAPGTQLPTYAEIRITPKNKYQLDASKFNNKNVIASKSGNDIILKYAHGLINQPTEDKIINIELCKINFANKKNYKITGDYTFVGENVNSTKKNGSYSLSGNPNVIREIVRRTITPNTGWSLDPKDIKSSNPNVKLTKKVNTNGSITVIEEVILADRDDEIDYTLNVTAKQIVEPNKVLAYYTIDTSNTSNDVNEERELVVYGEEGSNFSFIFKDTSNDIESVQETIPKGGVYRKILEFPKGNTAETFTITFLNGEKTDLADDFDTEVTIKRLAKATKKFTLLSQFADSKSKSTIVKNYIGTNIIKDFTQVVSLPSDSYTLKRQPTADDINFNKSVDNIFIENLNAVLDDTADTLTITGTIRVESVEDNVQAIILLEDIVNKNVTLTIAYSKTIAGGSATSNYSFSPASYTTTSAAELPQSEGVTSEKSNFTLTASSGYQFLDTINSDDFAIYDSSNTDVTETYAKQDSLFTNIEDDKLEVGFVFDNFNMPSADATITIRPKKEIAETVPVDSNYLLIIRTDNKVRDFPRPVGHTTVGPLTDNDDNSYLMQATFEIDRSINDGTRHYITFNDSSGVTRTIIPSQHGEITKATAGTYTDWEGNSVTITDHLEFNSDKTEVTVNFLVNINSVSTKASGIVDVVFSFNENVGLKKYPLIRVIEGQPQQFPETADIHFVEPNDPDFKIGSAVSIPGAPRYPLYGGAGRGYGRVVEGTNFTYIVDKTNTLITTEIIGGVERIVDIQSNLLDNDNDGILDLIDLDDDNDGVPDAADLFPKDPTESKDTDGDGIGDNTDPNDAAGIDYNPTTTDTDGDGIVDSEERRIGTDIFNPDTDGDGITDGVEVNKGYNPRTKDSDNDGVNDNVDMAPLNPLIGKTSDFSFDKDIYGVSGTYTSRSSGKLDEFGKQGGRARVHIELDNSPVGWSEDFQWRARLVDRGDGVDWVSLDTTSGVPVEIDDDDLIIRGDALFVNIDPTTESRDIKIELDLYYKNTKVSNTNNLNIKQNVNIEAVTELSDNTQIPDLTLASNIDQKARTCTSTRSVVPVSGGKTFPQVVEFNLGSSTGIVDVLTMAGAKPDRFVVMYDGSVVIDTGYQSTKGSLYQSSVDQALRARGIDPSPVKDHAVVTGSNIGPGGRVGQDATGTIQKIRGTYYGHSFNKNKANVTKAYILVYAPLSGTAWNVAMGCPNTELKVLIPSGVGGGG